MPLWERVGERGLFWFRSLGVEKFRRSYKFLITSLTHPSLFTPHASRHYHPSPALPSFREGGSYPSLMREVRWVPALVEKLISLVVEKKFYKLFNSFLNFLSNIFYILLAKIPVQQSYIRHPT